MRRMSDEGGLLDTFDAASIDNNPELAQLSRAAKLEAELAYTQGIASGEIKPGQEIEAAQKLVKQFLPEDPDARTNTPKKAEGGAAPKNSEAPKARKESAGLPPPELFRDYAKDATAEGLERFMWSHGIPTAPSEGARHSLLGNLLRTYDRERGPRS